MARVRRCWRGDQLLVAPQRYDASNGRLCRPDSPRGQAFGIAGGPGGAGRACGQSPDRQGARPRRATASPAARRRGDRVKRRQFITLLGSAAAWPLAARAQQAGKVIRIGFIGASLNSSGMMAQYQAFLTELQELGFSEGRNITVDYRRVDDPRGPFAIAAELMRLQVDLIVATGPEVALQAVVGASRSIPIVIMAIQYDPIQRGYVSSLARPGGNITGVFYRQPELAAKQLEILMRAFPERSRLAV